MKKIRLIFVASSGRSGSTILEMLLGLSETNFAVGEVHLLGYELKNAYQRCGCGEWVADCDFWSNIPTAAKTAAIHPTFSLFREKYNAGRVIRLRILLNHFFKIPLSHQMKNAIEKYNDLNYQFFSSLNADNHGNIQFTNFVDSSKDPYRMWCLLLDKRFDIKIIHLVKSPEEFSHGATKKLSQQTGVYFVYRSMRMIIRWIVENFIIHTFTKGKQVVAVDYHELATNTNHEMNRIAKFAKFAPPSHLTFRNTVQHGVAGNVTRVRSESVSRDNSWKHKIPKWKYYIAKLLGGKLYNRIKSQR